MEDSDSIQCGGKCCRTLLLQDDIVEMLFDEEKRLKLADGQQVFDMLLYKGRMTESMIQGTKEKNSRTFHAFTCVHLESGKCSIYESRPDVCRRHGIAYPCEYKECCNGRQP